MYLIDANVLIRADADYYPLDRVPQFWDWLLDQATADRIKIPLEIHQEVADGNDDLAKWIAQKHVSDVLILDEEVDQDVFNDVLANGYADDLNDTELQETGNDPFLVAYARMEEGRVVVTKETSKPSKKRGRRKLPDACDDCGIEWMDDFRLYRILDFRIIT